MTNDGSWSESSMKIAIEAVEKGVVYF